MDIGTNELTRPFRIPRRRVESSGANSISPDKTKRRRLGNESDSRSPLASTSSARRHDSAFSSRIIPPTKKKPAQDHQQNPSYPRKSKPGELFDRILDSMVNPPKERKKGTSQDDGEPGPSNIPTTANANSSKKPVSGLTREDLERHQNDNSACYAFMQREGLMERLLGHKMLTGRVDSHVVLGFLPFDPKDTLPCKNHKNSCSKGEDFSSNCDPQPNTFINEERRGPKTPPGSPGHDADSSMLSSRGVGSASPSSPPPPPPADETVLPSSNDAKIKENETSDLIAEMAELTKLPHSQLAECLGEELQNAMKQVDHKVLLETLKDALLKVGKKSDEEKDGQQVLKDDIHLHTVEMDLESNKSSIVNNIVLPPPPPAPRTPPSSLVPSLPMGISSATVPMAPSILPTPPLPPLVMLHPNAGSQVLVNVSEAVNASSIYPYFPPPPPQQLTSAPNKKSSAIAVPQTPPAASLMFPAVPYVGNSSLAVSPVQFVPHSSTTTPQSAGILNAFQSIPTPSSYPSSYTDLTPPFPVYPGSSSQTVPSSTTAFLSGNQYLLGTPAAENHYTSSAHVAGNDNSKPKLNKHLDGGPPPPTVLHPYAGATNYNITNVSVPPYSLPTVSITATTASNSFIPATNSVVHPEQISNHVPMQDTSFECGSRQQTHMNDFCVANSKCSFPDLKTPTQQYQNVSTYQTKSYPVPLFPHHQKQQQNLVLPETSSSSFEKNSVTGSFSAQQQQQTQQEEKLFSSNFLRPVSTQHQTAVESVSTSSSAPFNGNEAVLSVSRFIPSGTLKADCGANDAPVVSSFSSERLSTGRSVKSSPLNFSNAKSSEEPVSVPSTQNVIKTLLSALSIPQSSETNVGSTSSIAPNNSSLVPEASDDGQEVDFCWPPANMDSSWSQESDSAASEMCSKSAVPPLSSLSAQVSSAPRMTFFNQTASTNSVAHLRAGTSVVRLRQPFLPPILNRMPLNRLPRVPPGSSPISGQSLALFRAGSSFRTSGPSSRSSLSVLPLRPRIHPPFFARRPPFPPRPPPSAMRIPRPSFPR
ncbi:unnamed protein product [Thelazia callipaeda]|uniref:PAM2 domain-containing protein n=1 Tax=Thelazia callipaeda TaxID=103827 RepID=A0A0N5D7M0_THECL|nr:unnamed protein product [Thelazia callipaeda]